MMMMNSMFDQQQSILTLQSGQSHPQSQQLQQPNEPQPFLSNGMSPSFETMDSMDFQHERHQNRSQPNAQTSLEQAVFQILDDEAPFVAVDRTRPAPPPSEHDEMNWEKSQYVPDCDADNALTSAMLHREDYDFSFNTVFDIKPILPKFRSFPQRSSPPQSAHTTPTPEFQNPGPVCSMGPKGLQLVRIKRRSTPPANTIKSEIKAEVQDECEAVSSSHSWDRRSSCSSCSSCSSSLARRSSSSPSSRKHASHRLSPLPKNWSEELLKMPTKELNAYLRQQHFAADEIAELKTCRRRIKNRGYTRQSRQRKVSVPDSDDKK